ncbi:hypothetical protein QFZ79_004057 [Arthrobacter sp. V4I6]|uniref:hypothetical protein n=1 Tax=unclassified Arthrobacter TaxID=235627 RepID=UPI0027871DCE|nr:MULTISPECIES: hypothetical protein [unclassified Arthrobacter]MDQ0821682.1 hypothetical protein [Arthrobacter sp. V1I7]MDQ0855946.1 hypothetical protein [Arthrobacter sp. V4I6]
MADAASKGSAVPLSIRELPKRGRVLCRGFIEAVTYAPASQVAAFTATVVDHESMPVRAKPTGSGPPARLRVIWLGRRRIPGIAAGTELRLDGMVTVRNGLPTMFNPRYEILSRQEEQ